MPCSSSTFVAWSSACFQGCFGRFVPCSSSPLVGGSPSLRRPYPSRICQKCQTGPSRLFLPRGGKKRRAHGGTQRIHYFLNEGFTPRIFLEYVVQRHQFRAGRDGSIGHHDDLIEFLSDNSFDNERFGCKTVRKLEFFHVDPSKGGSDVLNHP